MTVLMIPSISLFMAGSPVQDISMWLRGRARFYYMFCL
jgi:hypothetical protein